MAQSTALLGYLAVVIVLFLIVFVIMFAGYKRLGRWRQTEGKRDRTEPVVGTEAGPTAGPQQLRYRNTTDPMNEDVDGNLARVPREKNDPRDNPRRS